MVQREALSLEKVRAVGEERERQASSFGRRESSEVSAQSPLAAARPGAVLRAAVGGGAALHVDQAELPALARLIVGQQPFERLLRREPLRHQVQPLPAVLYGGRSLGRHRPDPARAQGTARPTNGTRAVTATPASPVAGSMAQSENVALAAGGTADTKGWIRVQL